MKTLFIFVVLFFAYALNASDYIRPFPVIAIQKSAGKKVEDLASDLGKSLGISGTVMQVDQNPVCCIWIEIWNAGTDGYMINNQQGGSVVLASNIKQLELAFEQLKKLAKKTNGEIQIPIGLITNYEIVKKTE